MKFMSKIITQEYEHNMDFVGNIDFDSHLFYGVEKTSHFERFLES